VRDEVFRGCRGDEGGPNRGREKLALTGVALRLDAAAAEGMKWART